MTAVGVDICDICGKRMLQNKEGNLVLQRVIRTRDYTKLKNIRNWTCCKRCVNDLSAKKSIGDYIREDIENLIDEYCGKREKKILKRKIKVKLQEVELLN